MAVVDINLWKFIWEVIKAVVVWAYFFLVLEIKIFWPLIKPLLIIIGGSLVVISLVIIIEKPWRKYKQRYENY